MVRNLLTLCSLAFALVILWPAGKVCAQPYGGQGFQHGGQPGGYQHGGDFGPGRGFDHRRDSTQAYGYNRGGYFQRPYPYHLDYYRMRYGGSYAPYFGNLYGPPAVYAPFYGGGYGGGYGGYGPYGGGVPYGAYAPQGYFGGDFGQPYPPIYAPADGQPPVYLPHAGMLPMEMPAETEVEVETDSQ